MPVSSKDLLDAANAAVPRVTPEEARRLQAEGALMLDVRDGTEVAAHGRVPGAHHVSRGMLEFRADPASPYYDPEFRADRPVVLYCMSGGRSALAGKLLQDMGYADVRNLGGFKDYAAAGEAVEKA